MVGLIALGALVIAAHVWSRLRELSEGARQRDAQLEALSARLRLLEATAGGAHAETTTAPSAASPHVEPVAARAADVAPPAPVVVPPPVSVEHVPPPAHPLRPPPVVPPPAPAAAPPRDRVAPPPIPPPPPRTPPRPPSPPPPKMPAIDWEGLVGVKLFSWIAGIALVFAAVFFLRYSYDRGWLAPPIRMAIGMIVGVGLLVGCELRAARRYPTTANALDAAGIATLFATLFASHTLWNLIPMLPTFVMMALVAAVAVLLSIRRDSVFIALLGLVGGFATPALLSTGENRPIGLFGYLLVLNVGIAWVAHQRRWLVLTVASIVLTTLYQWAWVLRFLDESPLLLAMAIFLVFPAVQLGALALAKKDETPDAPLFSQAAVAASVVPLVFGLYLAAVPAYGAHMSLLFGFVLVVAVGLAFVAATRGPAEVHLVGAIGTVFAFGIWCATSYEHRHWPGVLGWLAAAVGVQLVLPYVATREGRDLGASGRHGRLAAAALLGVITFLAGAEPATASPWLLFGTLAMLAVGIAVAAVHYGEGKPHFLGALFAFAAEAIWSSKHLTPDRLHAAMLLYAGFGLFYAGVPIVAERRGRRLTDGAAAPLAILAGLGLVLFLAAGSLASIALPGIAVLLVLFMGMLFVPAVAGAYPAIRLAGVIATFFVLGVWWVKAMAIALMLPALLLLAALGCLATMGSAWLGTRDATRDESAPVGLGLAVIVHAFLLAVVVDRSLALPPWPWLGVLLVVDLAIATGAIAIRRAGPHVAAIVASQLVVMAWGGHNPAAPWPLVGIAASDVVALLGIVWIVLARRRGAMPTVFAVAAAGGVVLAQVAAMLAADASGAPSILWIIADQAVLVVALLAIAEDMEWDELRLLAVLPASGAAAFWITEHVPGTFWLDGIAFAAMPFVVFAVDARRRAPRANSTPSLQAALLSGAAALFLIRRCLHVAGLESIIGIFPVGQALVMYAILKRALAHRAGALAGDTRIALAAAGTLGFATAAIPLQLSLEHITVAWALEAAALAWLYRRIRFPQLVWWIGGIAAAVFVRLALNPAVLAYHPRATTPIFNWYLYLYLVSALALFAAAYYLRGTDDRIVEWRLAHLLPAGATVLLFLLVNIEIADYYSRGSTLTFNFFSAGLAQDLTYTIAWAVFAVALLAVGIRVSSRLVRGGALGLLVVTIVKCFLHDLWSLGGLYRVGSFVGLATFLSLVAVLLQRFVFLPKEDGVPKPETA